MWQVTVCPQYPNQDPSAPTLLDGDPQPLLPLIPLIHSTSATLPPPALSSSTPGTWSPPHSLPHFSKPTSKPLPSL